MICELEIIRRQIEFSKNGSEVLLLKSSVFKALRTDFTWMRDSDLTVIQSNEEKMKLIGITYYL